jgi:hypothetical protein
VQHVGRLEDRVDPHRAAGPVERLLGEHVRVAAAEEVEHATGCPRVGDQAAGRPYRGMLLIDGLAEHLLQRGGVFGAEAHLTAPEVRPPTK